MYDFKNENATANFYDLIIIQHAPNVYQVYIRLLLVNPADGNKESYIIMLEVFLNVDSASVFD